jgi:undecaprenyl-diphosphatase
VAFLHRFVERDRALFYRLRLAQTTKPLWRAIARALTHLGGPTATIVLAIGPLFVIGWQAIGEHAIYTLVLSHVLVQMVKRTVGRPRPSLADGHRAMVDEPDRFSFPSGHSAAVLSIALAYASGFPDLAVPLLVLAGAVGATRVLLGVHYPGDVAAGQSIAVITHWMLLAART